MTSHSKKIDPLAPIAAYERWYKKRPAPHISAPRNCIHMQEDKVMAIWLSAWAEARKVYA